MEPGTIVELQPWEKVPAAQPRIECKLSQALLRKVELAHNLAYRWAKEVIESECVFTQTDIGRWFNLDDCLCEADEGIAEAVEYLELMGLLERHPEYRNLVNVCPVPARTFDQFMRATTGSAIEVTGGRVGKAAPEALGEAFHE